MAFSCTAILCCCCSCSVHRRSRRLLHFSLSPNNCPVFPIETLVSRSLTEVQGLVDMHVIKSTMKKSIFDFGTKPFNYWVISWFNNKADPKKTLWLFILLLYTLDINCLKSNLHKNLKGSRYKRFVLTIYWSYCILQYKAAYYLWWSIPLSKLLTLWGSLEIIPAHTGQSIPWIAKLSYHIATIGRQTCFFINSIQTAHNWQIPRTSVRKQLGTMLPYL